MTEPLLNRASYDELVDSIGDDGARIVLGLFIDEAATYLATIAAAAAQPADAALRDKARRAAHSFKSGAGQIGAAAIAVAAAAVEAAAPAGGDSFTQSAETLRACTAETITVLRPLLTP